MLLAYDDFRTGLTFRDVYWMVAHLKWKTRHTVLGKWHELKLAMYHEYLAAAAAAKPRRTPITSTGGATNDAV